MQHFFSYSRKDYEFVERLARSLEAMSFDVWVDKDDLVAGSQWDRSIEDALTGAQTLIAVLSPRSVASDNVMNEISFAIDEKKLVIPILLETCKVPLNLRRIQHIDFETTPYEEALEALVKRINANKGNNAAVRAEESSDRKEAASYQATAPVQQASRRPSPQPQYAENAPVAKQGMTLQKKLLIIVSSVLATLIGLIVLGIMLPEETPVQNPTVAARDTAKKVIETPPAPLPAPQQGEVTIATIGTDKMTYEIVDNNVLFHFKTDTVNKPSLHVDVNGNGKTDRDIDRGYYVIKNNVFSKYYLKASNDNPTKSYAKLKINENEFVMLIPIEELVDEANEDQKPKVKLCISYKDDSEKDDYVFPRKTDFSDLTKTYTVELPHQAN